MTPQTEQSPREKIGWKYMIAGFVLILFAGGAFFMEPRSADPVIWHLIGKYLMIGGLVVYVVGRILRWRGKSERTK